MRRQCAWKYQHLETLLPMQGGLLPFLPVETHFPTCETQKSLTWLSFQRVQPLSTWRCYLQMCWAVFIAVLGYMWSKSHRTGLKTISIINMHSKEWNNRNAACCVFFLPDLPQTSHDTTLQCIDLRFPWESDWAHSWDFMLWLQAGDLAWRCLKPASIMYCLGHSLSLIRLSQDRISPAAHLKPQEMAWPVHAHRSILAPPYPSCRSVWD